GVRELIAAHIQTSGRDLEAAIDQLHTYVQLTNGAVTEETVFNILKTLGSGVYADGVDLNTVLEAAAAFYGFTLNELAGRKRTKEVAQARQIAMYLARTETDASFPQIAAALGGRDHTTVLYGCARIADLVKTDTTVANDLDKIRAQLARIN